MAVEKCSKGGQGGKKGHSNMEHWTGTEEIKAGHKKHLREESKKVVRNIEIE